MGFQFNPITGQLDISGSGGGSAIQSPNYFATFNNTTDWGAASGGEYTITVAAATHGKGANPIVQILELNGSDYDTVVITHKVTAVGNIVISVDETPDLRFNMKIIVSENN